MSDQPIPAATLIVVRDHDGAAPELLMVERAQGMAFAAGALVFPGGRIDEQDRELASATDWEASAVAAIRETLEETAVPAGLSPAPSASVAAELQQALVADAPFEGLLASADLELDRSALTPFARWVPKFHAVRRFDTLFYVARCPEGDWSPNIVPGECSAAEWVTATEVLEREQRGEARLIFPTRRNLERLARHASFEQIRADALAHPIEPITPWVEQHEGEAFITIPDNLGYPVTRERLEGLWRG